MSLFQASRRVQSSILKKGCSVLMARQASHVSSKKVQGLFSRDMLNSRPIPQEFFRSMVRSFSTQNVEVEVPEECDELEEYSAQDPNVGMPFNFIELPGTCKASAAIKPFSIMSYTEELPMAMNKEDLGRHLSEYLTSGGKVVTLTHGYESVVFEELQSQNMFQDLNIDDLTLIQPISAIETMTGRAPLHGPAQPMHFDEDKFQEALEAACPHAVPFRPGFAFEHVIHDLSKKMDKRNLKAELHMNGVLKYDDQNFTPSFLLPEGEEPKKPKFTSITRPAGRYMGDRVRDKILQVTSHLSTESVDLLILEEMDYNMPQITDYRYSMLLESLYQFELAVLDGLARGYGISSSSIGVDLTKGSMYNMYKVFLVSNYAAELARLSRGQPTKDPNFHPQQWDMQLNICQDTMVLPTLPDRVSHLFYTQGIDAIAPLMQENIKDQLLLRELEYSKNTVAENVKHLYEVLEDGTKVAKDFNPRDMSLHARKNISGQDALDITAIAKLPPTAIRLYRQRNVQWDTARLNKTMKMVYARVQEEGSPAAKEAWDTYMKQHELTLFQRSFHVRLQTSMDDSKDVFPGVTLPQHHVVSSMLNSVLDVHSTVKKEYYRQNFALFQKYLAEIEPQLEDIKVDYEALMNGNPLTTDKMYSDPEYTPLFLRNKKISKMITLTTNVNLFHNAAVTMPQYPHPKQKKWVTMQEFALAHGILFNITSSYTISLGGFAVRFETFTRMNNTHLANIRNEVSKITRKMQALEASYPHLASESGYENLPPLYALSTAELFQKRAKKLVSHVVFEHFMNREVLPAATAALDELENMPVFQEYVKQFRVLLSQFVKLQNICLEQTMTPLTSLVEDFQNELSPQKLGQLPSLESKLIALNLALQPDSVAMYNSDAMRPILDLLESERTAIRQNSQDERDLEHLPTLPSCVPTRDEAISIYNSFDIHLKKNVLHRWRELVSLCLQIVDEDTQPVEGLGIRYYDMYSPGESALLDPPIKETEETAQEYKQKALDFWRKHNLMVYTME